MLTEILDCAEVVIEELEGGPGMSDSTYEYYCGPRDDFIKRLRNELKKYVSNL